jgi:hypothetical protein
MPMEAHGMANNGDWLPVREQDFADLCQKWKAGLENPANVANFGLLYIRCFRTDTNYSLFPKVSSFPKISVVGLDRYNSFSWI